MKTWSAHTICPCTRNAFGEQCQRVNIDLTTSLDLANEELPSYFPCVPRLGDEIESSTSHNHGGKGANPHYRLRLKVIGVRFLKDKVEVELHLPDSTCPYDYETKQPSLRAWYEQIYQRITGRWFI